MEWTREWPKQVGRYWFLGYDFGQGLNAIICLLSVEVWKSANGFMYVCGGNWIYPTQAEGLWCKAVLPTWPDASV